MTTTTTLRWIRADTHRDYRLPSRCPRCRSRNIYASVAPFGGADHIMERCVNCEHNRQILLGEEA